MVPSSRPFTMDTFVSNWSTKWFGMVSVDFDCWVIQFTKWFFWTGISGLNWLILWWKCGLCAQIGSTWTFREPNESCVNCVSNVSEFWHTSGLSSDVIMKTSCDLWCQAIEVMWTEGNVGQFFISLFTSVHSALMLFGCAYVYRFKLISFNWNLYILFYLFIYFQHLTLSIFPHHTHTHSDTVISHSRNTECTLHT